MMVDNYIERYSRQIMLPEIGESGQRKLTDSSVLVVGAGGLGSPVSIYLAAAGIGRLGLIEDDVVEISNLQRQILYAESDLGKRKVEAAKDRICQMNSSIIVDKYDYKLVKKNARDIISKYDVVIDATDNFKTRYLISDTCVELEKYYIFGSVEMYDGMVTVLGKSPQFSLRKLFPEIPAENNQLGTLNRAILGGVPGVIASLQCLEAIKIILGIGEPLIGEMVVFNALSTEFKKFNLGIS